jgi:hypothetical protein
MAMLHAMKAKNQGMHLE